MSPRGLSVWVLLACWAPVSAAADPSPEDVLEAEATYQAAVKAFGRGDAVEAATLFRASYDLVAKPELLYNEAYALAIAGDLPAAKRVAIEALDGGLPTAMDAKTRARLDAWDFAETARAVAATPAALAPPRVASSDSLGLSGEGPVAPEPHAARLFSYVAVGAGVVGLGAALVLETQIGSIGDDMDAAAAARDEQAYASALRRGQRLQTIGRAAWIAGGTLIVTGIVVWLVSRTRATTSNHDQLTLRF